MNRLSLSEMVDENRIDELQAALELSEKPTVEQLCEIGDYLSVAALRKLDSRIRYKIYTSQSGSPEQCGEVWWDESLRYWRQRDWMVNGEAQPMSRAVVDGAWHLRELRTRGYLITFCACCVCCKEDKSANLLSRVLGDMPSHGFCAKHQPEESK